MGPVQWLFAQIAALGGDVSPFVHARVMQALRAKLR